MGKPSSRSLNSKGRFSGLVLALQRSAQVGVSALGVFRLVYPERFIFGLTDKLHISERFVTREVTGRGAKKPFKNREFFSSLRRAAIVGTVIERTILRWCQNRQARLKSGAGGETGFVQHGCRHTRPCETGALSKPRIILVNDSPERASDGGTHLLIG